MTGAANYDALLVIGFGGPEGPDDVMPFLENVTRGRNIPRERLLEVAEHYQSFGGVSPINQQVRDLLDVLKPALVEAGIEIPVYWGNRNWDPMLADTVAEMGRDGVRRALGLALSGYSSYSSCRQYRENIADARAEVGESAPEIHKIRPFFNHPSFISTNAARVNEAIAELPADSRDRFRLVFTAHSLPNSMAETSAYTEQLAETGRLVAEAVGVPSERVDLVYQSRSGPPQMPWLEPDICDHIQSLGDQGVRELVVAPIGFVSDHIEVLYDLDDEAQKTAAELGMKMVRAATPGTHPDFVAMIVDLVWERLGDDPARNACGQFPALPDFCPEDCCPPPQRRRPAQ